MLTGFAEWEDFLGYSWWCLARGKPYKCYFRLQARKTGTALSVSRKNMGSRRPKREWKLNYLYLQDLSIEKQQRWQPFTTNKRQFQEKNIKYALLNPTKLRVSHNGQFIIFTLSSDMEGCIRELLASAMNNLSQAATCEIIQLTRIYNTSWIFCFLWVSWSMVCEIPQESCDEVTSFSDLFLFFGIFLLFYWLVQISLKTGSNLFN